MIGVYKITAPDGKCYIGKSTNIKSRWTSYKNLRCKAQPRIYDSLCQHGVENHIFEVLEKLETFDSTSVEELSLLELKWYMMLSPELNAVKPAIQIEVGIKQELLLKKVNQKLKVLESKIMIRKMLYNLYQTNISEFTKRLILLRNNNILSFTLSNTSLEITYN